MDFKVRVRLNRATGEVELFEVVDEGTAAPLPHADHNSRHDAIASALGRVLDRSAQVVEILDDPVVETNEETLEETRGRTAEQAERHGS